MAKQMRNEYEPDEVSPPGQTLREIIAERGISQAGLASRMGRPQKTISEIINGKAAITPETALELELVLGVPAEFWSARERDYRTFLARRDQAERLRRDAAWAKRFPVREMVKLGWIEEASDPAGQVKSLLEFFGVASTEQWSEGLASHQVVFRKSASFAADDYALSAWLRKGIAQAERLVAQPYRRDAFLLALQQARSLTTQPPKIFQPELVQLCAGAGVAVAFVPELRRSRASGATMWIAPDRALIQLSLRYKTDDHLWFAFFHEAAHVLLHRKRSIFLEVDGHEGDEEVEANRWAADFLVGPSRYQRLLSQRRYSKAYIEAFAAEIGIAPGIIVGRLQHDGLLPHTHCNGLKRRFEWAT